MMVNDFTRSPSGEDQKVGCRFVEVLSRGEGSRPYGYRVGGIRPGPTALVAGYSPNANLIYDRLLDLPTLPWLRGTLVLITLDALEVSAIDEALIDQIGPVDRTLHLPFNKKDRGGFAVQEGYWAVLKLCAQLGMISGRGVSLSS